MKTIEEQIEILSTNAPQAAKVILMHTDGRLLFAVEHAIGSGFWYPDGRVSKLQGIFYDTKVVARRENDKFILVEDAIAVSTPASKSSGRMKKFQEIATKSVKTTPAQQVKEITVPVNGTENDFSEFISVRKLSSTQRNFITKKDFISIRKGGRVFMLSSSLREKMECFDIEIDLKNKVIRIVPGVEVFSFNKHGKHTCHSLGREVLKGREDKTFALPLELREDGYYYGSYGDKDEKRNV